MNPVKVSVPAHIYRKIEELRKQFGYTKRGHRWTFLDLMLDHAAAHPDLFRKR